MYCVKCGVKLSESETVCPLCSTRVYHPDLEIKEGEPPYPKKTLPKKQSGSLGFPIFATACFILGALISFLCDLHFNRGVVFSGYVAGALFLAYVSLVLPLWFRAPNPVIFVPCSFAAALLYLLYIDLFSHGAWFLSFALPVTACFALIVCTVCTLTRYLRRGRLFIFGGAFIALGLLMLLIEFLLCVTFPAVRFIGWYVYPLSALSFIGAFLIFLGICRPARESMERLFFI